MRGGIARHMRLAAMLTVGLGLWSTASLTLRSRNASSLPTVG
jgi:hypothetical protein